MTVNSLINAPGSKPSLEVVLSGCRRQNQLLEAFYGMKIGPFWLNYRQKRNKMTSRESVRKNKGLRLLGDVRLLENLQYLIVRDK